MMTKKEKLELAQIIAEAVVKAMKETATTPTSANEGRKTKTSMKAQKEKSARELDEMISKERREVAEMMKKGRGSATTTKYSMKLADYEPKKVDGFYKWGKKTDTIKSRNYRAMQIAYCYAVATKGKAVSSDECFKLGIEVDYSDKGAYGKAKAEFKKKYKYIPKADR
jgi:hypothetical protein